MVGGEQAVTDCFDDRLNINGAFVSVVTRSLTVTSISAEMRCRRHGAEGESSRVASSIKEFFSASTANEYGHRRCWVGAWLRPTSPPGGERWARNRRHHQHRQRALAISALWQDLVTATIVSRADGALVLDGSVGGIFQSGGNGARRNGRRRRTPAAARGSRDNAITNAIDPALTRRIKRKSSVRRQRRRDKISASRPSVAKQMGSLLMPEIRVATPCCAASKVSCAADLRPGEQRRGLQHAGGSPRTLNNDKLTKATRGLRRRRKLGSENGVALRASHAHLANDADARCRGSTSEGGLPGCAHGQVARSSRHAGQMQALPPAAQMRSAKWCQSA